MCGLFAFWSPPSLMEFSHISFEPTDDGFTWFCYVGTLHVNCKWFLLFAWFSQSLHTTAIPAFFLGHGMLKLGFEFLFKLTPQCVYHCGGQYAHGLSNPSSSWSLSHIHHTCGYPMASHSPPPELYPGVAWPRVLDQHHSHSRGYGCCGPWPAPPPCWSSSCPPNRLPEGLFRCFLGSALFPWDGDSEKYGNNSYSSKPI